MPLIVSEIFHSIQGESSHAGRPCVFVRLTGCNLRCAWCDTSYAFEGGRSMSAQEVLRAVAGYGCGLVEITGGEPLAQAETPHLIRQLLDQGYEVLIETNGSLGIQAIDARATAILDIKCPGSGMSAGTDWTNLEKLRPQDELKFVLAGRDDFDYAARIVGRLLTVSQSATMGRLPSVERHIHFSPVQPALPPRVLAEWILVSRLPVRLGLQLHKIIWSPETRGV